MLNLKKQFLTLFLLVLITATITSCSKDNDDTPIDGSYHLKAKIGDKEHTFNNVSARWVENSNYLEITGMTSNNEWLAITVLSEGDKVPTGKYTLDDATPFSLLSIYHFMENGAQRNFTASEGTIWSDAFELEITKINSTNAEGRFSGILVRGSGETTLERITVENGTFNAPFKN